MKPLCAIVSLTCVHQFVIQPFGRDPQCAHLRNLHQLLDDIPSQNVIEHNLQKIVVDDGQFQLIAVPDENLGFVNGCYGDLEVIVSRHSEVFRRIEKLVRENDVKRFLILRHDESVWGCDDID